MFVVEKSNLTGIKGVFFLKGQGLCLTLPSINEFLESEIFLSRNAHLVKWLKKGKQMIEAQKEGIVSL